MKKEEKVNIVNQITESFKSYPNLYFTDVSNLTVEQTTQLRKLCYKHGVKLQVAKNTFIKKALEKVQITDDELLNSLKGPSSFMYSEVTNAPAKLIKEFRRTNQKPLLKAAYIENMIFVGDNNLDKLVHFKSKEELIADIVFMLNSPIRNLLNALNSGSQKLMGVLETLEKKNEK
jgi:large subunit ribosomal protein L10